MRSVARWQLKFVVLFLFNGCIHQPYHYLSPQVDSSVEAASQSSEEAPAAQFEQISHGQKYGFLDGVSSWTFGAFPKLLLWDKRVENHEISEGTEGELRAYLADNNLTKVKVRLNEYAPLDEWSRLFENDSVGWGWRLTGGVITNLFYTLLPGRIFGGDSYNPFTDTISLYSDHPAIALHEGGHAKDFAGRTWKGSYAFLQIIPLASLFSESEASSDALSYLDDKRKRRDQREAYFALYPAYSTYIGGEFVELASLFSNVAGVVALVPVIPAHIIGRYKGDRVPVEDDPEFEKLRADLTNADPAKRAQAARQLAQYGPPAAVIQSELEALLRDGNSEVREAAEAALEEIR